MLCILRSLAPRSRYNNNQHLASSSNILILVATRLDIIMKIKEMSIEDLDKIDLDEFDDFWNENILKSELENPTSYYIIAKLENEIVGFAGLNFILDEAHISNIVIKKTHRNKKIGSKLLSELIEKAKSTSSLITLEVSEENPVAIHIYKKYGFETVRKKKKILQK